jgi:hypothetical protein
MIGQHHTEAIARITGELVPLADRMLPTLRRRLATKLMKHSDAIVQNIGPNVEMAILLYGKVPSPAELARAEVLAIEVQAKRGAELRALVERLATDPNVSLSSFARSLVEGMRSGMELHATKRLETEAATSDEDLRTIVEADACFRVLHYFLEALKPYLDDLQPRSMLAVRSA